MSTVQDVYTMVAEVLLEPQGLVTGVYTEAQFLEDFREVLWDFVQQTGLVKALICLPTVSGTAEVLLPDYAMNAEEAMFSGNYLHYTTALEMDNLIPRWRSETGVPKRWHDDRLPVKTIGLQPKPNADGGEIAWTAPLYGTISSTSGATEFSLAYSAPIYGTFSIFSGPIFVETTTPVYGTFGTLVPDSRNVTIISPVKPMQRTYVLTDGIDIIPDSFLQYLKYGVLAYVFGRDGETRDKLREQYCQARYSEGISLAQAISMEALEIEEVAG